MNLRELYLLAADVETPNEVLLDAISDLPEGVAVAKVYVVMSGEGEYSDYREYQLMAFLDKEKADECRDELESWFTEFTNKVCAQWDDYKVSDGPFVATFNPRLRDGLVNILKHSGFRQPLDKRILEQGLPYDELSYFIEEVELRG